MIRNLAVRMHWELEHKEAVRYFVGTTNADEGQNTTKQKKTLCKSIEIDLHSQTKWDSLSSIKYPSLFDLNLRMVLTQAAYWNILCGQDYVFACVCDENSTMKINPLWRQ